MLNAQRSHYWVGKVVLTCVVCQNLGEQVLLEIGWVLLCQPVQRLRAVKSLIAQWERWRAP